MLTDKSAIVKNITLTLWTGSISLVVQYVCAHFLGAETPAILGSIAAIVAIIAYAKLFIRKKDDRWVICCARNLAPGFWAARSNP